MKNKALLVLYVLAVITMIITFSISRIEVLNESKWFNILGNFYFIVIAFVMILLSAKTIKSDNMNTFTRAMLGGLFIKFLLSALMFAVYCAVFQPKHKWYVLPFFINYLIFSLYEVYFIQRLVKEK